MNNIYSTTVSRAPSHDIFSFRPYPLQSRTNLRHHRQGRTVRRPGIVRGSRGIFQLQLNGLRGLMSENFSRQRQREIDPRRNPPPVIRFPSCTTRSRTASAP